MAAYTLSYANPLLWCGHLQLFGLDAGEKRRPLIGCCRDAAAAAARRCRSRVAEAIGRRRGSSLSESSLSEVLNRATRCVRSCCCRHGRVARSRPRGRTTTGLWMRLSRLSRANTVALNPPADKSDHLLLWQCMSLYASPPLTAGDRDFRVHLLKYFT